MLGHTARLLYGNPSAQSQYWVEKTAYFAMVESLLTHARSLMDFLYRPRGGRSTDVFASDFIGGWRPPAKWRSFRADRDRIGREIMHLSFDRPPLKTGWNYGELVRRINDALRMFIRDVDHRNVTANFKERARAAMADPFAGWTSTPTQTFQSATRLVERGAG
jgi:hypothetical protein